MNKFSKNLLAIAVVVVGFSSCLKDKGYDDHEYGHVGIENSKIIELAVANSPKHDQGLAVDFVDQEITRTFVTVRLASIEPASEDIVVTLDTAHAILDTFKVKNDKPGIELLPASFYSFVSGKTVTIPKGQREAKLQVKLNASDFDPSTTYGVGFKIVSVDKPGYIISENFGQWVTTIGAKNKYDGVYEMRGVHNRPPYDADPYTGANYWTMHMITTGAASVIYYWADAGAEVFGHPINGAGGWYGGTFLPILDFDPATNKLISVSQGSPGGVSYTVGPSTTSRFDPATKTIYAEFYYNGNLLRKFSDTLTYVGPRP